MAEVTVFDGAGCIGGNKVHLSFDDGRAGRGLFFDFGMSYSKIGRYYEEFLRPRSNRGIHDLLAMGIVPPLTCYRHDIFPEDVDRSMARPVTTPTRLSSSLTAERNLGTPKNLWRFCLLTRTAVACLLTN